DVNEVDENSKTLLELCVLSGHFELWPLAVRLILRGAKYDIREIKFLSNDFAYLIEDLELRLNAFAVVRLDENSLGLPVELVTFILSLYAQSLNIQTHNLI